MNEDSPDRRPYRKICVGGTFDIIHAGHRALLQAAFEQGEFVFVGLGSDRLATDGREREMRSYKSRKKRLARFIEGELCREKARYSVVMIDDLYGKTLMPDLGAIVVSEETAPAVEPINRERKTHGLEPLETVLVSMVKAGDGGPVSATRIARGEIMPDGSAVKEFTEEGFDTERIVKAHYPEGGLNLLLHVCCAPCLSIPLQHLESNEYTLMDADTRLLLPDGGEKSVDHEKLSPVGIFFNPNIHPSMEFMRRMQAVKGAGFPTIYSREYDLQGWLGRALKADKVGTGRCSFCYEKRLERTAAFAVDNGFEAFSSTLLSSPHQKHELLKKTALKVAGEYKIPFLYFDLRDRYGDYREFCKKRELYVQNYCGCIFSEREKYERKMK